MKTDPVAYAKEKLLNMIDDVDEMNNCVIHLKSIIKEYFSDLQSDETPAGAMRRLQIRKELLEFANK